MPITEGFEMLRVTLDDKLNFEKHRVKVCRRLSQQVTAFTGMKKDAPLWNKEKNIYFAFIFPHFNYCSKTQHFCGKSARASLEKAKERTLRFVFIEKQTHYQELPTAINCDWAPISKERLMDFRNVKHEFRIIDILQLPNVNTTTYQLKSWSYLAQ